MLHSNAGEGGSICVAKGDVACSLKLAKEDGS